MRKKRLIHLPTTVGGNAQTLSRFLSGSDLASESWAIQQNYLAYSADYFIAKTNRPRWIREIRRVFALRYVLLCDAVFFNFGQTLFSPVYAKDGGFFHTWMRNALNAVFKGLQRIELFILKLRGVPIFVQYQGDDARQGDYSLKNFSTSIAQEVDDFYYAPKSDAQKRKQISLICGYADRVYALNPDLLRVLPEKAQFLPYSHIDLDVWKPQELPTNFTLLRIGHAPTHRQAKGTKYILEALESLGKRGFIFELVLVEGVSHDQARNAYESIDVLVDQLLAGWYGGLAVELMALGKPVIAYIREEDLEFIPTQMRAELPIVRAGPETIESVLESILLMGREEFKDLGLRSRAFVEQWHSPIITAERIKRDLFATFERKNRSA